MTELSWRLVSASHRIGNERHTFAANRTHIGCAATGPGEGAAWRGALTAALDAGDREREGDLALEALEAGERDGDFDAFFDACFDAFLPCVIGAYNVEIQREQGRAKQTLPANLQMEQGPPQRAAEQLSQWLARARPGRGLALGPAPACGAMPRESSNPNF